MQGLPDFVEAEAPRETAGAPALPVNLPAFVAEQLAADIEGGVLRPGDRLSEEAIAARFGISRSPVREALRILQQEELVHIEPRKGASVRSFAIEEVDQLFEMRAVLYGLAVELFGRNGGNALIATHDAQWPSIRELAADPATTPERFAAATQRSSAFIVGHCGNARLQSAMRKMTRQAFRHFAILAHTSVERRRETAALGTEMMVALRNGQHRRAGEIGRLIVEKNHAEVMRQLRG